MEVEGSRIVVGGELSTWRAKANDDLVVLRWFRNGTLSAADGDPSMRNPGRHRGKRCGTALLVGCGSSKRSEGAGEIERAGKGRGDEGKVGFVSALQRIEVRVNAGRHDSVGAGRETTGDRLETMGAAVGKAAGSRCRQRSQIAPRHAR
jgi:hypothetical protein